MRHPLRLFFGLGQNGIAQWKNIFPRKVFFGILPTFHYHIFKMVPSWQSWLLRTARKQQHITLNYIQAHQLPRESFKGKFLEYVRIHPPYLKTTVIWNPWSISDSFFRDPIYNVIDQNMLVFCFNKISCWDEATQSPVLDSTFLSKISGSSRTNRNKRIFVQSAIRTNTEHWIRERLS